MADINMSLFPGAPTLEQRMSIQSPAGNMVKNIQGVGDYMAQQNQMRQQLLVEQAKTLGSYQNMYMAYTGQRNPNIDAVLKQNPYGQVFMGQMGSGNPNPSPVNGQIPMAVPSASGGLSMGMFPQMAGGVQSLGNNGIQPIGAQAQDQSVSTGGGPVITGGSSTFAPFGDMGPKSTQSFQSPAGEAAVAGAKSQAEANVAIPKEYATKMAGSQADAQIGTSKDINQLQMVAQNAKQLANLHQELSDAGVAGDVYGGFKADHLGWVPKQFQNSVIKPDVQNKIGQFTSMRNEAVTKMQPFYSQQFGKEGSSRIMDSLLKMSGSEIGTLQTPHTQFRGQLAGTLSSLYRIQIASQQYQNDLMKAGLALPKDEAEVTNQIASRVPSMSDLTPDQQTQLNTLVKGALGGDQVGSQFNPINQTKKPVSASTVAQTPSRDEIMAELKRRSANKGK